MGVAMWCVDVVLCCMLYVDAVDINAYVLCSIMFLCCMYTVYVACIMAFTLIHISYARMIRLAPFFDGWIPREERRKEERRKRRKITFCVHTVRKRA